MGKATAPAACSAPEAVASTARPVASTTAPVAAPSSPVAVRPLAAISWGNIGSITSHSSSVTSSLAMPSAYPPCGFVRRTKALSRCPPSAECAKDSPLEECPRIYYWHASFRDSAKEENEIVGRSPSPEKAHYDGSI